jgi:polysaccharide export outer membrane protein
MKTQLLLLLVILATIVAFNYSCSTQNLFETSVEGQLIDLVSTDSLFHHVIRVDDKVSLSIWNHDDISVGSLFSMYSSNEAFGKWVLVDANGQVKLPQIGNVQLAGLTCPEAADTLEKMYGLNLVDPVIVVKVLNRQATVLGEVRLAGNYILEKERNTVTELIGMAQGFTLFADYEEVRLIRNGISYKLDFTVLSDRMEHVIVVEAGDIINVPARKAKTIEQKSKMLIPFSSALTAIAVAISISLR